MNLGIMQRVTFIMTLLKQFQGAVMSGIAGRQAVPKFFDFDDEELDKRYVEILDAAEEAGEWDNGQLLELAAIFLLMYLKEEFEGLGDG
jgi:hypothetical protein